MMTPRSVLDISVALFAAAVVTVIFGGFAFVGLHFVVKLW